MGSVVASVVGSVLGSVVASVVGSVVGSVVASVVGSVLGSVGLGSVGLGSVGLGSVGFGGTYGHLCEAMQQMQSEGKKVALAHFEYINPLPRNTEEILRRYKKIVVAEQNMGQLAGYLRSKFQGVVLHQYNEVKGQPFAVESLANAFTKIMEE